MTSLRIHTSSNPMQQIGQILPQSKDDALFFRLRRERARETLSTWKSINKEKDDGR
ncbi:hypothetical protein [Pelagerythrobacter marinus]|uniref:hypothetical protein n=1 Tax=Pelagerythrobacter marinus TaxID=538382 RepID=UPI002AC95AAE|nr:hypothetical protein [Pelagerythrobacter marinus]WPZ05521.1 hypothetical protein T8T98_08750 [Pelagerythrobacter marinus]